MKSLIFFLLFIAGVSCAQNIADTSMLKDLRAVQIGLTNGRNLYNNFFVIYKSEHNTINDSIFTAECIWLNDLTNSCNYYIKQANAVTYPAYIARDEWIYTITSLVNECTQWRDLCVKQLQENFKQLKANKQSDAIKKMIEDIAKQYLNSFIPIIK